ncbi:MAG: hypothetical protein WA949_00325 [Phormidesmis sp.]
MGCGFDCAQPAGVIGNRALSGVEGRLLTSEPVGCGFDCAQPAGVIGTRALSGAEGRL